MRSWKSSKASGVPSPTTQAAAPPADGAGRQARDRRADPAPQFLAVAQILTPFGLKGLVHARLLTDFPERFARLKMVYLGPDASPYVLESARLLAGEVHLKLGGVDGPEQAARLRDVLVQIPISEAMPLSEGQYYQYQIVGMAVSAIDGEPLGRVVDILSTGGNDVYVVHGEKGEILLPAIAQVVKEVDVAGQRMVVELMDGMRAVITSAAATGS